MSEDEAEYNYLVARCRELGIQIDSTLADNARLEEELNTAIYNVGIMINNCVVMDKAVYDGMHKLSNVVGKAEISAKEIFDALNELSIQYFTFKSISTASKNMTQLTDEYHTSFSYYNELRRITLGYVVGLDSHIISSETARKKVEKAYLENTDYWLAYSIMAVMLWASDAKDAADRAMNKSLSMNYFNTCLFFLLINLRFNRVDAARKWYVNYLDRADMGNLGNEWQYLLQAYLVGAFGANKEFQEQIAICFKNMLAQVEVTTVDFRRKFTDKALKFAQSYIHTTERNYGALCRNCIEYNEMKSLLSSAEKNAKLARYYNTLVEAEIDGGKDLAQRIENVLYSVISNYDDDEFKIIKKLKYNEAVVMAKGDISAAQIRYNTMFAEENKRKSLGDMFLQWAFDEDSSQTDIIVRRFSISFMKEWIAKGFAQFAEEYRRVEREKYTIEIDQCELICNENDYDNMKQILERHYDKNRWKDVIKDKFFLVYTVMCAVAVVILAIMPFKFNKIALTFAILIGLAGSFLLWRRIVDLGKILREKMRQGVVCFKHVLDELRQWRNDYKEADAKHADLMNAIERIEY
jgi:hypothetical protein